MAQNLFGNTFGITNKAYNGGKNIWHEVKAEYPIGGTLTVTSSDSNTVIAAGSLFFLDMANHKVVAAPSDFSTSTAYAVGDYCVKSNVVYKCKATHEAGAWAAGDFEAAKGGYGLLKNDIFVGDEVFGTDDANNSYGAVTATLVYEGEVYASRTSLTASDLALVPHITPIYEA